MRHRRRQEALFTKGAAVFHRGKPGHRACRRVGSGKGVLGPGPAVCARQARCCCSPGIASRPAPTRVAVAHGGGLPQDEALRRQQAPYVAAAGRQVRDDELCRAGAVGSRARGKQAAKVWMPQEQQLEESCVAAYTSAPPRLTWMPMRCSLRCRVTKERAAVASRPCTRLRQDRRAGQVGGQGGARAGSWLPLHPHCRAPPLQSAVQHDSLAGCQPSPSPSLPPPEVQQQEPGGRGQRRRHLGKQPSAARSRHGIDVVVSACQSGAGGQRPLQPPLLLAVLPGLALLLRCADVGSLRGGGLVGGV